MADGWGVPFALGVLLGIVAYELGRWSVRR